jgi:hypothetical protein
MVVTEELGSEPRLRIREITRVIRDGRVGHNVIEEIVGFNPTLKLDGGEAQ